jgi:hypothetical protein
MILRCELGKSRLWAGEPLVVSAKLELEPGCDTERAEISSVTNVFLRSVGLEPIEQRRATPLPANLPPSVAVVETLDIAPGAYEVALECAGARTVLPELIWLLSRQDYQALARAEASEPFGLEPIITTGKELAQLLDQNAAVVWPGFRNPFQISWSPKTGPLSYPPIQWTSEAILRALRHVGAFGISSLSGFISIGAARLEMGVEMTFEYPLPDAISDTFHDEECSDLYLLNSNQDLGGFEVDIDIRYNRGRIAVRQTVPELQYA